MTVTPVTDTAVPFDSRGLSAERKNEREKNKRKIEKDRASERAREPHTKADFAPSPPSHNLGSLHVHTDQVAVGSQVRESEKERDAAGSSRRRRIKKESSRTKEREWKRERRYSHTREPSVGSCCTLRSLGCTAPHRAAAHHHRTALGLSFAERCRALKERGARENTRIGMVRRVAPRRPIRESIVVYRGSVHIRRRQGSRRQQRCLLITACLAKSLEEMRDCVRENIIVQTVVVFNYFLL